MDKILDSGTENWLQAVSAQQQVETLLRCNEASAAYGLVLSQADCALLLAERQRVLKQERRVELGRSILPELVKTFCVSPYLNQDNYVETLLRLQEIFFCYKNEMLDEISDGELLQFMQEQFDTVCFGDLDYLEGTCLDIFAQAIRAGYRGQQRTAGRDEFTRLDIVTRWDRQLYLQVLQELTGWR